MAKSKADTIATKREKQDLKEIVQLILDAPVKKRGALARVTDDISMEELVKENTDVKTRIFIRLAGAAMNGDIKAAELIMRYAGLEPVKEANLTVTMPTIIDDMSLPDTNTKKKKIEPPMYVE